LIFSKCPRCDSGRIRRGYRRTPIWRRAVGRYYLLCNACNWEFAGWAIPGTVDAASARRRKKRAEEKNRQAAEAFDESKEFIQKTEESEDFQNEVEKSENNRADFEAADHAATNLKRVKHKKRIRIKLNE
jgi:hypothetical protein